MPVIAYEDDTSVFLETTYFGEIGEIGVDLASLLISQLFFFGFNVIKGSLCIFFIT